MKKVGQFLRENATAIVFLALVAGALWALIAIPPREVGWIRKLDDVRRVELENEARKTDRGAGTIAAVNPGDPKRTANRRAREYIVAA
jgi:hypothetical protein